MTNEARDELKTDLEGSVEISAHTPETPLIFTTTDPMGRTVQLKQSTWEMHVIGGDHNRKELIGQEKVVEAIIANPKYIVPDVDNETRERYYDLAYLSSINKIKPVMVVVDYANSTGDVCTIFVQSRMRETGERGIVYERKKS